MLAWCNSIACPGARLGAITDTASDIRDPGFMVSDATDIRGIVQSTGSPETSG
jgi:hypothetical protein